MAEQKTLAPGQDWEILKGDVVTGHLSITEQDGMWHLASFRPGQLFDQIADLFCKIDHGGKAKGWDERQADVHRLKQLGVKVRLVGEQDSFDSFALFVESDQAKLRVYASKKIC